MKIMHLLAGCAALSLLSACGGGSGGVASTPTPTPTATPTNVSFDDLKYNQSFTNDADGLAATWDLTTNTGIDGSAKSSALTVSYDAKTKGYTVSVASRSQTFTPADITSQDDYVVSYKTTGTTGSDYLTLLGKPSSGNAETQYVRMGFWQHNAVSNNQQSVDYETFAYGFPTAAAAVPRTGSAAYAIDTFGVVTAPGQQPRSFQGAGQFNVDFAQGIYSTDTYLTETELVSGAGTSGGGIELNSQGQLSSSDGTFSGNVLYGGWFGSAAGTLNGRFYGPNGEELGASFYGSNTAGMAVVGSLVGQQDSGLTPANMSLLNMTQPQLFYTQFGNNMVGQLNWQNSETFTASPPSSDLYGGQFTINDKVASSDPNFTTYQKTFTGSYDTQDVTLSLYRPGPQNTELALTYASFGHWSTSVPFGVGRSPVDEYFAYGFRTPNNLLSAKTGSAHYDGVVYATGRNIAADTTYDITGTSAFDVNFTAQSFAGSLAMAGVAQGSGAKVDFGSYAFNGNVTAYSSSMTGDIMSGTDAIGHVDAQFYGPDGQELAGTFNVNVPAGAAGAGTGIQGAMAAIRH